MTDDRWRKNLETVIRCGIPHISAYALTVEEKTTLHWMISKEKYPPVSEEQAARQYMIMVNVLKEAGYLHYEISNFCLPDFESKHNSNYWKGASYLGVGPSAHSFNGTSRRWNVSNISEYVNIINEGGIAYEEEVLTPVQRYNEYVMTGLRTMWGCKASYILEHFGSSCHDLFIRCTGRHLAAGGMWQVGDRYGLTDEGMLFADGIAAEFFMEHG
jgi:oxygen-independent coproporphyrinogen-3 oxidase